MNKFVSVLMVLALFSGSVNAFSFGSFMSDVSVGVTSVVGNAFHSFNAFFVEDVYVKSNKVSATQVEISGVSLLEDAVDEYNSDYKSGVMRSSIANEITGVLLDEGFEKVFYKVIDEGKVVFILEFDLRDFSAREVDMVSVYYRNVTEDNEDEVVVSSSLKESELLINRAYNVVDGRVFTDFLVNEWVNGRIVVKPSRVVNLLLDKFL